MYVNVRMKSELLFTFTFNFHEIFLGIFLSDPF